MQEGQLALETDKMHYSQLVQPQILAGTSCSCRSSTQCMGNGTSFPPQVESFVTILEKVRTQWLSSFIREQRAQSENVLGMAESAPFTSTSQLTRDTENGCM